jgi:tRNA (adenine37-N6)-methyltransferase
MAAMDEVRYRPIGVVHSPFTPEDHTPPKRIESTGVEGTVEVLPDYVEGLRDLDGFSHVFLLSHLHLSTDYALTVKPPSDTVTHGVFATRSPRRPNPISLTLVRLQKIDGNVLHVIDIDLVDGTPVLDIKPYTGAPASDDVRTGWMQSRGGS